MKQIENVLNVSIIHTKPEHFVTFARLPLVKTHNDPVDRIIIAQAITERMFLISSDCQFKHYKELDFIYNKRK